MFFDLDLKGNRLSSGTVCLTYDDGPGKTPGSGPGPRTLELGEFLHEEGIPAAFFVVGRHAEEHPDILARLGAWGHLIGNHTYNHPGLVALAQAGGDVVGEVQKTDELIAPHVGGERTYFRAPYGNWREKKTRGSQVDKRTSIVAELLNLNGRFGSYVGPVNWDISNEDWNCWSRGLSPAECAQGFLRKIEAVGQGIVLMHDSSVDGELRARNHALPMTKILVRLLKERGFRFVRLDAIPALRSAARVVSQVYLKTPDRQSALRTDGTQGTIVLGPARDEAAECFGLVPLADGRFALRASQGQFLSVPGPGQGAAAARACSLDVDADGSLTLERLDDRRVAFRTSDGSFLVQEDDRLQPASKGKQTPATFVVEPRFGPRPLE